VDKRISRSFLPALFLGLFLFSVWSWDICAQSNSLDILSDTSYFKNGKDDWNLVESVKRIQPANVLFLLKRGADPNASEEGGITALMYAAQMGDTLLIKLLVLNGADLELTSVENTTPLMVAVLNQQFGAAHLLLKREANPDHQDKYGGTSIIYASAMNDYAMADLLLFFGATDSLKDLNGNDAMMTAVSLGHLETADVLLQNGIYPDNRDKKQRTPLMVAAQQGNIEMLNLLLENGAEKELTDYRNYTPLAHAIRSEEKNVARVLVDSGANVNHFISRSQNMYDLARKGENQDISKILKTEGAEPSPRPDFSEFGLGWGNSFGKSEHMMQGRIWWMDQKFGFFAETGFDIRPVIRTVQVEINDTLIHQYRETRSAWTHGAGKYFTLIRAPMGIEFGVYAGIYGMLSFPKRRGISENPGAEYNVLPSAGLFLRGKVAGIKAGTERYIFGIVNEGPWKTNITIFLRIPYNNSTYEYKEIGYEPY